MREGKRLFEVYYEKHTRFGQHPVTIEDVQLQRTHSHIRNYEAANFDEIFEQFQVLPYTKVWLEENVHRDNTTLESKDVHHTSMSVGDVVHDVENGKWYRCAMVGWEELK